MEAKLILTDSGIELLNIYSDQKQSAPTQEVQLLLAIGDGLNTTVKIKQSGNDHLPLSELIPKLEKSNLIKVEEY